MWWYKQRTHLETSHILVAMQAGCMAASRQFLALALLCSKFGALLPLLNNPPAASADQPLPHQQKMRKMQHMYLCGLSCFPAPLVLAHAAHSRSQHNTNAWQHARTHPRKAFMYAERTHLGDKCKMLKVLHYCHGPRPGGFGWKGRSCSGPTHPPFSLLPLVGCPLYQRIRFYGVVVYRSRPPCKD